MNQLDWQPSASLDVLERRAQLLADVRRFFYARDVMEVDTPILSQAAPTAPYLDSFHTEFDPLSSSAQRYFLQTSPEFAMKRLLAAGLTDIFQIAKVFRNSELGKHHNPEFTMIEWYRASLNYQGLMNEVDKLLQDVAQLPPAKFFSYARLFQQYVDIDVCTCNDVSIREKAFDLIQSLPVDWETDRDGWLELLMSEVIEPKLVSINIPIIVYDFPASQAQLAKLRQDEVGHMVAARFEVYAGGLELANGYDECTDADELRQRFKTDNDKRQNQGLPTMPIDIRLLASIEDGLPACTGVALGLDRLLMLMTQQASIEQVQAFSFNKS